MIPAITSRGLTSAVRTRRSYHTSSRLKRSANDALNRAPHDRRRACSPGAWPAPWPPFISFAQNNGTTEHATKYEATSDSTTASASAENRNRLTPYKNITGKNTTELVSVAARTAMVTSSPPFSAATSGDSPISR